MSEPTIRGLEAGLASEEEIAAAQALVLDRLADSLDGLKLNAVFAALMRLCATLDVEARNRTFKRR